MAIDRKTLEHTAELARLNLALLPESEVAELSDQLQRIVAHFDQLAEVDTGDEPVASQPFEMRLRLRADEPVPAPGPDVVLSGAPDRSGDFFRVPRVVGESGGEDS